MCEFETAVVGITGPFQHGKTELRPVIENAGWQFLDLNDVQNALRTPGTERRAMYEELIPGGLDDDGGETVKYYQQVTPETRRVLLPAEINIIAEWTNVRIQSARSTGPHKLVLSWELLPAILDRIKLDHVILFCQHRQRWFDRLRTRIAERGWQDWLPGDEEICRLIRTMNAEPEKMLRQVRRHMRTNHSLHDVGPDDWGAGALVDLLSKLA